MLIDVKVPVLPESVADGTLSKWHKHSGAVVRRDENLVDLETDKVVLEIPAPQDGVLTEIKYPDGAVVKIPRQLLPRPRPKRQNKPKACRQRRPNRPPPSPPMPSSVPRCASWSQNIKWIPGRFPEPGKAAASPRAMSCATWSNPGRERMVV